MSAVAVTPRASDSLPRKGPSALRRLLARPSSAIAACVVGLLVLSAIAAPLIAPYSPTASTFTNLFSPPTWAHPFGTDELGRDLLTRVLYGGRTSLMIAFAATIVAMAAGTLWGFTAAFRGGWVDEALMRTADAAMAMPVILLGLVLVAAFGASTFSLIFILGVLFTPATARLARSSVLAELKSEYYLAAVAVGTSGTRILAREVFPNTLSVLIPRATLIAAEAIFVEASLSFVGLGVQPPGTSWGTLLQQGYTNLYRSYWYSIFPGIVILVAVIALNALGDGLQRVLDPSHA